MCIDFLNTLINPSKFWWSFFFRFLMYRITSSANRYNFASPLPFHTHFISFSCLINLAIFSNTSQDSSTENRHPWLIPNVRGNAQVLFNTMMPKCIKAYNCIFLMTGSHQHIVSFFFSYHCFCLKYIQFDEVQFFFCLLTDSIFLNHFLPFYF